MSTETLATALISALPETAVHRIAVDFATLGRAPSATTIGLWFTALANLQRKVAGSSVFLADAAHAICEPGGLDAGFILQRDNDMWRPVAEFRRFAEYHEPIDFHLLSAVEHSRVACQLPDPDVSDRGAVKAAAVAAPILHPDGSIWGIVYGIRAVTSDNRRRHIRPLEALWLQLVAESLSSGVARLEAEERSLKTRILFEQAFAPQLVQELQRNPELLTAREQMITVLFCDLRDFSRVAANAPPRVTYDLLSELMDMLTTCVMDQAGAVVDYYGDGLSAMWNAPLPQSDHAERACRAAWEMQSQLPKLSQRWHLHTQRPLRLGCGIHTGSALVGNSGSHRRPKYGPRGVTVNTASRLESATKIIKSPIVLSQATLEALPASLLTHRVATFRVPGNDDPLELYRLCWVGGASPSHEIAEWIQQYAVALHAFESGQFEDAHNTLVSLRPVGQANHLDSEFLLHQVAAQLDQSPLRRKSDRGGQSFDPVISLNDAFGFQESSPEFGMGKVTLV